MCRDRGAAYLIPGTLNLPFGNQRPHANCCVLVAHESHINILWRYSRVGVGPAMQKREALLARFLRRLKPWRQTSKHTPDRELDRPDDPYLPISIARLCEQFPFVKESRRVSYSFG